MQKKEVPPKSSIVVCIVDIVDIIDIVDDYDVDDFVIFNLLMWDYICETREKTLQYSLIF